MASAVQLFCRQEEWPESLAINELNVGQVDHEISAFAHQ